LWLASDNAGYVSGHILVVDAGVTTGSSAAGAMYEELGLFKEYSPMLRERGRSGL